MLDDLLQELLDRIPGSAAAILVGSDGLVVGRRIVDKQCPFEQLAAHGSLLFKNGLDLLTSIPGNELHELVLVTGKNTLLWRSIGTSYFVMLVLSDSALLGKARYILHKTEMNFVRELT